MNIRKLQYITYCLLITLPLLTSCKDDDKKEADKQSVLIGTWGVTQFSLDISIGGISLADYLVDSLDFSAQEVSIAEALIRSETDALFENETINFKADQTFEVFIDDELQIGNWALNEDQTALNISVLGDQQIALEVSSLSDEVFQFGLSELVQVEDFLDTSSFGISFTESLLLEGNFTLIKQK